MYNKKEAVPEYFPFEFINKKSSSVWYYLDKEKRLGKYSNWYKDTFYEFMSNEDTIKETPFYILIKTIVEEMCKKIDKEINNHKL